MVVEVELTGNGKFSGAKAGITDYSVTEEILSMDPSDTSGGTGQLTFTALDDTSRFGSRLLMQDGVKLTDDYRGVIIGKITQLSGNAGLVSVTASSRLEDLVSDKSAKAYTSNFGGIIRYYMSLAGVNTDIVVDPSLENIPVRTPDWEGDVWTKIKELCTLHYAEVTLIRSTIVVRPVRRDMAADVNKIDVSWDVSNFDMARKVEVFYYNYQDRGNTLIYPQGGWNEDVQVLTVDAGQTVTVNLPVDVWLRNINQPIAVDYVDRWHASSSVYSVSGNDGLPITASQWNGTGGQLGVQIGEDQRSIDVTIRGADGDTARLAPYRIAVSSGPSNYYSSLRLTGSGMHFERKSIEVPTGADVALTVRDVGVSIDNVHIDTLAQAQDVAARAADYWSAPKRGISVTQTTANRPDPTNPEAGLATFGTFDAYTAANGLTTFAQFDAAWAGKTFGDLDAYFAAAYVDDFSRQSFGNTPGVRLAFRRSIYRIRSVQSTPTEVSYSAEEDTTFADFDASCGTMTFGAFDSSFAGMTFSDFALAPLPNVLPELDNV